MKFARRPISTELGSIRFLKAFVVLGCIYDGADGFGLNYWKIKGKITEQQRDSDLSNALRHGLVMPDSSLADSYISQPIDHFDPLNKVTFNQRYWVNDAYWRKEDGPVFLYIGGEGALGAESVHFGAYIAFAQTHEALVLAVEHRFYGSSIIKDGLHLTNLGYLSSQQALADLAWFHKEVSGKYNITEHNRWISFGGSYAGALSAWFRIKYPHLIYASVASSAPVEAIVDFTGYNDVVTNSLGQDLIGGSTRCVDAVKEAFKVIDEMLADQRRAQLKRDFQLCSAIISDNDAFAFATNLADIFMAAVQYNGFGSSSVAKLCKAMLLPGTAYHNLVNIHKESVSSDRQNCSDYSWDSFLSAVTSETVAGNIGMRQWTYQTCSQFGYYQTCDLNTSCVFSRSLSLGPNLELCQSAFNLSSDSVYRNVDFTNSYYGSIDPQGSRIVFVNGLIDPWHALSIIRNITSSELTVIIPSTSHCADMLPDQPSDPPALLDARQTISKQIGVWLGNRQRATLNSDKQRKPTKSVFRISNKLSRWFERL